MGLGCGCSRVSFANKKEFCAEEEITKTMPATFSAVNIYDCMDVFRIS